jgi:hypothetical protein
MRAHSCSSLQREQGFKDEQAIAVVAHFSHVTVYWLCRFPHRLQFRSVKAPSAADSSWTEYGLEVNYYVELWTMLN